MGGCFNSKHRASSDANGYRSAKGGNTGYQQSYETYLKSPAQHVAQNQAKPARSPQPAPEHQSQVPNPAPVTHNPQPQIAVQKLEPNNILGKPFKDVKSKYTIGKELGRGQFGITYLRSEIEAGRAYTCNSILKRKLVGKNDKEDMKREVHIMQHLSGQPNIVEFKGAYEDKRFVHVVMELCGGGELFDRIIAQGHYSERVVAELCRQIVNVVHH